jgi:hypothetical protein
MVIGSIGKDEEAGRGACGVKERTATWKKDRVRSLFKQEPQGWSGREVEEWEVGGEGEVRGER